MAKWKVGDIVQHKCTHDKLFILHVKEDEGFNKYVTQYVVRLPNYQKAEISEFELEPIRASGKIKDMPVE